MNCADAETSIAARLDGELEPMRARALDAHLADCPACAAELASLVDLKARLAEAAPYHRAPPDLRREVDAMLADADRRRRTPLGWLWALRGAPAFAAGAVSGAAALALVWVAGAGVLAHRDDSDLARVLVDAHVQATLGDHLIAVVSSDQHTVKPWLSSRLDYSPPIVEAPIGGVTLAGARIELIGGERVATLVYRFRLHSIDVFVRPAGRAATSATPTTIRGFNVAESTGAGMEWRAVSDVNLQILEPLVARLAQPVPR